MESHQFLNVSRDKGKWMGRVQVHERNERNQLEIPERRRRHALNTNLYATPEEAARAVDR